MESKCRALIPNSPLPLQYNFCRSRKANVSSATREFAFCHWIVTVIITLNFSVKAEFSNRLPNPNVTITTILEGIFSIESKLALEMEQPQEYESRFDIQSFIGKTKFLILGLDTADRNTWTSFCSGILTRRRRFKIRFSRLARALFQKHFGVFGKVFFFPK